MLREKSEKEGVVLVKVEIGLKFFPGISLQEFYSSEISLQEIFIYFFLINHTPPPHPPSKRHMVGS